jgi:hypothetical protein
LGGAGCPEVAEFAVAELAAALGVGPEAGRKYLGEVLEVRYRLPKLWCHLEEGKIPAWKACRVAQATMLLSAEAAKYVDDQVWWCVATTGPRQLDGILDAAIARHDPDRAEQLRLADQASLRFDVRLGDPTVATGGKVAVEGFLDLADARDVDAAVAQEAEELRRLGSEEPLDVRRARALGVLARRDLTLDLNPGESPDAKRVRPRQVIWHVHSTADLTDQQKASGLVRVEETSGFVTAAQFRTWCGPDTQLVIKPVIDLAEHIAVDRYEISDRLAEQSRLTRTRCAHPRCTRKARRCDCDHAVPHAKGGATCSCNLVPLCRFHHRLKTRGGWSYVILEPGLYLWRSRHGNRYLVTRNGTHDLTNAKPSTDGCRVNVGNVGAPPPDQ